MIIRDLEGNEFFLEANTDLSNELNGNKSLSFVVHPSDNNKLFIHDIDKLWEVIDTDNVVYKIIYLNPRGKGKRLTVQIKAVPKSFDDLNIDRVYERIDRHMTAFNCFSLIFDDTDYSFILLDTFSAVQWEGFADGDTRLEMFKKALNRYGAEFELLGNQFRIRHMIGRDTQFMYHYKLNASNISKEEDASNYWTHIKGFGDYGIESGEDGEIDDEPKLKMEYTSPLAELVGIRHAPPVKDGRITVEDTMMSRLKDVVDNSVKVNVSTTLHDLRNKGYPLARPQLGDRIFLVDDRIRLNTEMRVVSIREIRNVKDELIKVLIDLGTDPMSKRRQSNLNHAANQISDLLAGKIRLPISAFDETITRVSKALQEAQTEVEFGINGIIATDKDDPNRLVIFNSEGLGVSIDGGATFRQAITSEGINAEQIIGINSEFVRSSWNSDNGRLYVDGDTIHSIRELVGTTNEIELTDGRVLLQSNESGNETKVRLDGRGLEFETDSFIARMRFNGVNLVLDASLGLFGNHINSVSWIRFIGGYETVIQRHPTSENGGALIDSTKLTIGLGFRDNFEDIASFYGRIDFRRNLHLNANNIQSVESIAFNGSSTMLTSSIGSLGGGVLMDGVAITIGQRDGSTRGFSRIAEFYGQIHFHRNIYLNGNSIFEGSDERIKENIKDRNSDDLATIKAIDYKNYDMIDGNKNQRGFIAQQLLEIDSDLIVENDGLLGYNSAGYIHTIGHALQQLAEKVEKLEGESEE